MLTPVITLALSVPMAIKYNKGRNFSTAPNVQVIKNIKRHQEDAAKLDPDPIGELHVLQEKQKENDKTSKKLKGYIRTVVTGLNSVTL